MKRIYALLMVLAVCAVLTGCCLSHEWVEASCTAPKTCAKCEKTEGEALGHTWADATCTEAKTCTVCAVTEGEALGHTWTDATCTEAKTCTVCAVTEGEALGHTWVEATCEAPVTCTVCAAVEGEALGHWISAGSVEQVDGGFLYTGNCGVCGAEELSETYESWELFVKGSFPGTWQFYYLIDDTVYELTDEFKAKNDIHFAQDGTYTMRLEGDTWEGTWAYDSYDAENQCLWVVIDMEVTELSLGVLQVGNYPVILFPYDETSNLLLVQVA